MGRLNSTSRVDEPVPGTTSTGLDLSPALGRTFETLPTLCRLVRVTAEKGDDSRLQFLSLALSTVALAVDDSNSVNVI